MKDRPISKFFLSIPLYAIVGATLYYFAPFVWTVFSLDLWMARTFGNRPASNSEKQIVIQIEDPMFFPNVEAYCNDVYLGTTPVRIPFDEFKKKVPVWSRPPRQERIALRCEPNETDVVIPRESYDRIQFSYAPRDDFFLHKMDDNSRQYEIPNIEVVATNQYWLQLRKNGCLGGVNFWMQDFTGSGNNDEITISTQPTVEFPSQGAHLDLVLLALRHRRYQPDRLWVDHVLAYKDMLIDDLIFASKSDERLQPAIDALLAKEFDIPAELDETQCKRILDDILDRTEVTGFFRIPSLEATALELVAPKIPAYISKKYEELLNENSRTNRVTKTGRGINEIIRYHRDGRAARQLPLEHAIRLFHPPQIYNRLVYEYAKSQRYDAFVSLLSHYSDRRTSRMLRNRLRRLSKRHRLPLDLLQNDDPVALNVKSNLIKAKNNNPHAVSAVAIPLQKELYEPNASDREKSARIFESELSDRDKIARLARINHNMAFHAAMKLLENETNNRKILIYELSEIPNPVFDDFLIQQTRRTDVRSGGRFSEMQLLLKALYRANTAETREAIETLCESNRDALYSFVCMLGERSGSDLPLVYWTGFLANLKETEIRKQAVDILIATETGESWETLSEWLDDSDETIRDAVKRAVDECERAKERIRQLLSGEMSPDDLLPPAAAYVWNGEDYVKESNEEK